MDNLNLLPTILTWASGLAFICYGFLCLVAGGMTVEFKRYGLIRFRRLVGFLEILGGLGSILGLFYPYLWIISTSGLSLLMLLGVIVRIRIKDPFILILPAFILMLINVYILKTALSFIIQ